MSTWKYPTYHEFVGFVDESGDMRHGEPHVVAGLVFPQSFHGQCQSLAKKLMEMTPPKPLQAGNNKVKWPKAEMLPPEGLKLYVESLQQCGVRFINVTKECVTETKEQAARDMVAPIGTYLEPLVRNLRYADQCDLRISLLLRHFGEEARRHPFYFQMIRKWLQLAAQIYRNEGLVPLLKLTFDQKFQVHSEDVLNLLVRGEFYTAFANDPQHQLPAILGLSAATPFTAKVSRDPDVPCLYLADIYAHACGCVVKKRDPDGRFQKLLNNLVVSRR